MKFVVWAPPYSDRSAGNAVLHRLSHWLTVLGEEAATASVAVNPDWEERVWDGKVHADTIAIYPEAMIGNPLGARKIVRWALSHPGFKYHGSPVRLDPADLYFVYADRFIESTRAAVMSGAPLHRLFVSVYPSDMFYPMAGKKMHDAYYVGRGGDTFNAHRDKVDLENVVPIVSGYQNRYQLAKALRRVDKFYCFDQVTAMLAEAALCGARPFQIYDDGTVKECLSADPELMGVFGSKFEEPGDVENFVRLCQSI